MIGMVLDWPDLAKIAEAQHWLRHAQAQLMHAQHWPRTHCKGEVLWSCGRDQRQGATLRAKLCLYVM